MKIAGEESERKFKGDLVVAFCVDERKDGAINVDTVAVGDFSDDSATAVGKYMKMGLIKALSEAMND